jgi:hypothetical protein
MYHGPVMVSHGFHLAHRNVGYIPLHDRKERQYLCCSHSQCCPTQLAPEESPIPLVSVDESGCDKRIGFRRTGWSSLGVPSVEVARFHRDRRFQILPTYTQAGVLFSRVFQGSTDGAVFEDFIEQLLHHCQLYPAQNSVLIMDNASFYHGERIE